ncbi:amidohydrolase family protein [Actibacterium mucosum]|nr:amidohydrolase family protein [Actibacterium mucosum]
MTSTEPVTCVGPDKAPRPAGFTLPAGACDSHAHVFNDASNLVPERAYTPSPASVDDYRHMLSTLGLSRGVIVQPSVYGADNRATMQAVDASNGTLRAVVVLPDDAVPDQITDLHARGARGARINALHSEERERDTITRCADMLADFGWHLQMLIDVSKFAALEGFVRDLPVPVVFDHMGHVPIAQGVEAPGFQSVLRLMKDGHAWAKLSAPYRMTAQSHPPYTDLAPFAQALVAANPDQCLWGSDWPHPFIPVDMPNDGALLDMLADWVPDTATRNRILVDNPARLYGF